MFDIEREKEKERKSGGEGWFWMLRNKLILCQRVCPGSSERTANSRGRSVRIIQDTLLDTLENCVEKALPPYLLVSSRFQKPPKPKLLKKAKKVCSRSREANKISKGVSHISHRLRFRPDHLEQPHTPELGGTNRLFFQLRKQILHGESII